MNVSRLVMGSGLMGCLVMGIENHTAFADQCPVYAAADAYRDAVVCLEDEIRRHRLGSSDDRRWVDRFEDSTSDLRSAARRPEDLNRLLIAFQETQALQDRVEALYFGYGCPGDARIVARHWRSVQVTSQQMERQILRLQQTFVPADPGYGSYRDPVLYRGSDPYRTPFGSSRLGVPVNPLPQPYANGRFDPGFAPVQTPVNPRRDFDWNRSQVVPPNRTLPSAALSSLLRAMLNR
ncbi:MAG: hypothetical protein AAGD07_08040 [Planctomycetota bacterium]